MKLNKTIVWSPRGELYPNNLKYSGLVKKIFLTLAMPLLKNKNIVYHSTCDRETQTIKAFIGKQANIIQIPNFLKLPKVIKRETDSNYFLYVGRLHPDKGLNNIIKSLSISKHFNKSNYQFNIVGDNSNNYAKELEQLSKKLFIDHKINFLGHIKGIEKQKLFANAKFSFLNSFGENFGNVVVESLAQGTPVVASIGTPWKILTEHKAGFWIENDPINVANAIDSILEMNDTIYNTYRTNAYFLAKDQFDIDKNIVKWIKALELFKT